MFGATVLVLRSNANDCSVSKYSRGDASGTLRIIVTFDFVFILLAYDGKDYEDHCCVVPNTKKEIH
jgi:hypothetical protein